MSFKPRLLLGLLILERALKCWKWLREELPVGCLGWKCYEQWLRSQNLIFPEKRRAKGNLIEVLKIAKGIDSVDAIPFFVFNGKN